MRGGRFWPATSIKRSVDIKIEVQQKATLGVVQFSVYQILAQTNARGEKEEQ